MISTIRARIVISFLLMLGLLSLVTAVALIAGRTVTTSFALHEDAYKVIQRAAEAGNRATLMELGLERYARSENATDQRAAQATLDALQVALQSSYASWPASALEETSQLPEMLAKFAAAISARRAAGAGVADAAITLNTSLTAIHATARQLGFSDAEPIVLRLQSSAQRCGLLALRFQMSASPAELEAARGEIARDIAGLQELAGIFASTPRLQRQLEAAMLADGLLHDAIEGLSTQTGRRTAATAELNGVVARIREALTATQVVVEKAGTDAQGTLLRAVSQSARAVMIVAAVAVVISLASIITLNRACVMPLNALVRSVRGIAAGKLESAVPYSLREDEIGEVARAVVVLRDGALRARMLEVKAAMLADTVRFERQRVATQKANATQKALGGVAHTIGRTAERLLVAADSLNGISGRTSSRAGNVVVGSQQSRGSAEGVVIAAERLVTSVENMSRDVTRAAAVTAGAARHAAQTEGAVRALSTAATDISGATQLIAQVAARTRLLALNANIEATRAGDAGRGFLVVAGEVKALAAQTAAATVRIGNEVEAMKGATTQAIDAINAIREAIGSVDLLATHMVIAVEEHHATMSGIVEAASDSAMAATEVAAAMMAVLSDADEAARSVDSLRVIAAEVSSQGNLLEEELGKVVGELRSA